MTNLAPAVVGMPVEEVETPALLIELDAFERNLETLAAELNTAGVRLRPHAKTHKSPVVTLKQMALGAVGACCQTVFEAETLVRGGVGDVLVTNQIVGRQKIVRLAFLAEQASIGVCVDNAVNVAALSDACVTAGTVVNVLVEIDVGCRRCGVPPGQPALELARQVQAAPGLHLGGVQAYHGSAQHIRDYAERGIAISSAAELTNTTVELFLANGLSVDTVAGAGTGSYPFEVASGVYNELQCGSYVFMDADYARNHGDGGGAFDKFAHSLFVLTSVISTPETGRVVIDAGLKAHSMDSGMPDVHGMRDVSFFGPSDEHGNLDLSASNRRFNLGDKLKLIPGHCDPTVNLYDWYVVVRDDRVVAVWPIAARGGG